MVIETAASLNDSGIFLTEANRPFDAITLFRRALVIEPENALIWLNLGIAQQHTGDYEEAKRSLYKALTIDYSLSEAWLSMGLIHYELNEFELSEDCYKSAIENNNKDPKAWNNLGVLYFAEKKFIEARECFEIAVSFVPHYYDALVNIRDVCRELGDYVAAAEFERSLSELTPRNR